MCRGASVSTTARPRSLNAAGGPWAILNSDHASYAVQLGFVPDACRIRQVSDKVKTERRRRDVRCNLMGANERIDTLVDLQVTADVRVRERVERLTCPLTGQSGADAWALERPHLSPLPATLPTPFDLQVSRAVNTDSPVWSERREYCVPFAYTDRTVQVRGCAGTVEIHAAGRGVIPYPRHTACRRLIDQRCYEGRSDG